MADKKWKMFADTRGHVMSSNWSPQMLRVLLDYLEEHKGPDSILLSKRQQGLTEIRQALRSKVQPEFHNDLPETLIDRKLLTLVNHKGKSRDLKLTGLFERGMAALNLQRFPQGTFTEEELAPIREAEREKRTPVRRRRVVIDLEDDEFEGFPDDTTELDVSRLKSAAESGEILESPDIHQVREVINEIFKSIANSVDKRLTESGRGGVAPVIVNTETSGFDMQQVLATLLTCDPGVVMERLGRLQAKRRLDLNTFARATVAAAVTRWTLMVHPWDLSQDKVHAAWVEELNESKCTQLVTTYHG
jgi:hypothetical protein